MNATAAAEHIPADASEELITVLIPAYNGARFIGETLRSVRRQSHRNLEVIVVDDGSTDETVQIVEQHAQEDPRIRLLRQAHGGVSKARNLGLANARGSLIAQIDSDDVMRPDRLAKQAAFLSANPDMGFCGSAIALINGEGDEVGEFTLRVHSQDDLDYMIRNRRQFSFTHPTVTYRRSAIDAVGGYDSAFEPAEDLHLFLRMHDAGFPGVALAEKLTSYRLHLTSISGSRTREQVQMKDYLFHNFYAGRRGQPPIGFAEYRKRGSVLSRSYAWWREQADIVHSKARYRRGVGLRLRGTALMLLAVAMKAERFPGRALKLLARKLGR